MSPRLVSVLVTSLRYPRAPREPRATPPLLLARTLLDVDGSCSGGSSRGEFCWLILVCHAFVTDARRSLVPGVEDARIRCRFDTSVILPLASVGFSIKSEIFTEDTHARANRRNQNREMRMHTSYSTIIPFRFRLDGLCGTARAPSHESCTTAPHPCSDTKKSETCKGSSHVPTLPRIKLSHTSFRRKRSHSFNSLETPLCSVC